MAQLTEFYAVRITAPDGKSKEVELPKGQVEFMARESNGDAYASAAWLAYTHFWMEADEADKK